MKNILFLFSFLMVVCLSKAEENKFFVGLNCGVALTKFKFENKNDLSLYPTGQIHTGILFDFRITKDIFISSGFNYRVKEVIVNNIRDTDSFGFPSEGVYSNVIRNNYISTPIIITYQFGKKLKFRIGAGGYYSYLLKASIDRGKRIEDIPNPQIITNEYSASDIGLAAKVGLLIPLGRNFHFNFEIIEEFGLRNIIIDDSINGKVTTQSVSAEIGLRYAF